MGEEKEFSSLLTLIPESLVLSRLISHGLIDVGHGAKGVLASYCEVRGSNPQRRRDLQGDFTTINKNKTIKQFIEIKEWKTLLTTIE